MHIFVSGSLAYDRIMDFPGKFSNNILPDKIHILNVSFFVNDLKESFGGTAGNIAYNLALLGERPTILANAGKKDFSVYRRWLQKHKIDLSQIKILANQQTASAYIITDQDDNQITGFYPGAMKKPYIDRNFSSRLQFSTRSAHSNNNSYSSSGGRRPQSRSLAIVSPQNPMDMVKLPKVFKARKIPYIFDPGQQVAILSGSQLRSAISGSKVLIGNDYEISLTSKKTGWSLEKLRQQVEILVVTLGEKGSRIWQNQTPSPLVGEGEGRGGGEAYKFPLSHPNPLRARRGSMAIKIPPAKPKNTSDPTGAGDAFRAGLIYGLVHGWPLPQTGRLAALVAVYTVEKYGTQTHHFTWPELKKRYQKNFGEELK